MEGRGSRGSSRPPAVGSSRGTDDLVDLDDDKEESIRVCTRMRPLFAKEVDARHIKAWRVERSALHLVVEPPSQLEMEESRNAAAGKAVTSMKKAAEKSQGQKDIIQRHFVFDRCFDDNTHNEEVFDYVAKDIVLDCFKGINGCVFAYGQTGSGKTHSIMGVADDPGILPRSLAEFFDCVTDPSLLKEEEQEVQRQKAEDGDATEDKREGADEEAAAESTEYLMRVSYVEIYLERVNDLLQESPKGGAVENLEVKEDPKKGFVVVGLHEETVATMEEAVGLIAKAEQRRHFARTNFNETSSRSHVVFSITLESTRTFEDGSNVSRRGELKIVDLAGNEKAGRASEGVENAKLVLEEGKAINKSLFLLSEVISKLSKQAQMQAEGGKSKKAEKEVYIPWRDSKLTRLLQKALGGNSRASVLVAVHPSNMYLDTSFSSLRFALKCKSIKKKVCVNFFSPEQSLIAQQKKLILSLQSQLKALAGAGTLFDALPQRAAQAPENNEEVQQLKIELENKINKFQQFIMKATKPPSGSFGSTSAFVRRKTMRSGHATSGFEGFRRMDTLAAAKQHLKTIDKLNSSDLYGVEGAGVNLTKAFEFLGNKPQNKDAAVRLGSASSSTLALGHMDTFEPAIDAAVQELEDIDDRYEEPALSTSEEEEGLPPSSKRAASPEVGLRKVDLNEEKQEAEAAAAGSGAEEAHEEPAAQSGAEGLEGRAEPEVSEKESEGEEEASSSAEKTPLSVSREASPVSGGEAPKKAEQAQPKEAKEAKTVKKVKEGAKAKAATDHKGEGAGAANAAAKRVGFAGEDKKGAEEAVKKKLVLKKRDESVAEAGEDTGDGTQPATPVSGAHKPALKKAKKKVTKKKVKVKVTEDGLARDGDKEEEKNEGETGDGAATDTCAEEGDEQKEEESAVVLREAKQRMEGKVVRLRAENKDLVGKLKKAKALGLEAVSKLTFRFKTEHEAVKKLQQRVQDLQMQARYSAAILNKLGLSVLFTANVPASEGRASSLLKESSSASLDAQDEIEDLQRTQSKLFESTTRLSDFLKSFKEKGMLPVDEAPHAREPSGEIASDYFDFSSPSEAFKGLMFPDIDQVKPLAYAMLNDVLARLMVMQAQAARASRAEIEGDSQPPRLLESAVSIMKGEGIRGPRTDEDEGAADESDTLEQVEAVLGLVPSKSEKTHSQDATTSSKINELDEADIQTTEEKRQKVVKSVLALLSPWEQNMMALLYEQQEMRRALGELRDHFFRKLREMQVRFKRAMLEKVEFSDHCERLLGALMEFKADLQRRQEKKTLEEDTNAKFGKLMSKIEEMSLQLSQSNADYRLLTTEYKLLMARNDELRNMVEKLKMENATLLVAPQTLPHFEEINGSTDDPTLRALGYDVCLLQRYGSRLLVEVEEARAAEADIRLLNSKLYTELSAANDCVHDLKNHINLANGVYARSVASYKSQIADLEEDIEEKNARIEALDQEVASLRARLVTPKEGASSVSLSPVSEPGGAQSPAVEDSEKMLTPRSGAESEAHAEAEKKKKVVVKKVEKAKAKPKAKSAVAAKKKQSTTLPSSRTASPTRASASSQVTTKARTAAAAESKKGAAAAATSSAAAKAKAAQPTTAAAKKAASESSASAGRDAGGEKKAVASAKPAVENPAPASAPTTSSSSTAATAHPTPSPSEPAAKQETQKPTASGETQSAATAPGTAIAKAPAFTGDPRDKGFANMASALSRRRKKTAA
ncbi:putative kinesin heavy chain [Besnoitia besnoiti]|uniref:Putative kinesin heavy chain n=1 Tax=Besnoitia besnoiti TaxID=94643 RepID=A0A2A9MM63_BESBE|nr:putative kinesin heavy chain [Besnoitia besnoiti]PFH38394.1 putative kinesin heavy chain [Besnoitia besnoiti]